MKRFLLRMFYKIFNRSEWASGIDNQVFGKFRVVYPDKKISQPFYYNVAKSYRNIFGGKIIDNF